MMKTTINKINNIKTVSTGSEATFGNISITLKSVEIVLTWGEMYNL